MPTSGVFAQIYYDFETQFMVYPTSSNVGYYHDITKRLGHGVKIARWEEKRNVQIVKGLNSIEAGAMVDGKLTNEMTIDFFMTGDITWMKALMGGTPVTSDGITTFTKGGVPKTLRLVIYIQNDADDENTGDLFILKGVVVKSGTIEATTTDKGAVSVTLELAYATEDPKGITDIPTESGLAENVFNFAEGVAYFWNPGELGTSPASFNSVETIIDKFTINIDHASEMLHGVGSALARNKYHGPLLYTLEMDAIFKEKERFFEKFYGCKDGPVNDVVAPFRKVLLVLQNSKFCGEVFRRVEFEFNTVKLSAHTMPIDAEAAIMEKITTLPINCVVRMWSGAAPDAEFCVSPYHVKQGDVVVVRANHFPPGENVRLYLDGSSTPFVTQQANCMGAMEYQFIAEPSTTWSIGKHTIHAEAYTAPGSELVELSQDVYVTTTDGTIPKLVLCPTRFEMSTSLTPTYGPVVVTGYGFGTSSEISGTGRMYIAGISGYNISGFSTDASIFTQTIDDISIPDAGSYLLTASAVRLAGGTYLASALLHITNIEAATEVVNNKRTITATGMIPGETCYVYIKLHSATDYTYLGATTANQASIAFINTTYITTGAHDVKFVQNDITSDTGEFVAVRLNMSIVNS